MIHVRPGKLNVGAGGQIGVAAECVDPGDSSRQNFEWRELHTTYQPDYDVMGAVCSAHVKDAKSPCPRHEDIGGLWDTVPLIHKLSSRWRRVVNLTPRTLYPVFQRIGSWVFPRAELNFLRKKIITLVHSGFRNPDDTSVSLITTPTELSRLVREKKFAQNHRNKIWTYVTNYKPQTRV